MPSSILDVIRHYQRSIEKSPNDEARLLHCLDKLYRFPVEVEHLQETGVGKTVNSLRKYEGEVGVAAKALVSKWKAMVAAEDSHINENYEQHHIESQQYHEREQDIHNDTSHNNQSNHYSDHDKNELGNTNNSSSSIRHSSHSSSRYKDIKSSSKESSNKSKHHDRKDDTRHKHNSEYEKYRRDGSKESDSKRLKHDEESINACGSSSSKTSKQIEVYDNSAALPDDCGIDDADDDDDEENNLVIDVIKDKRDDNEKRKSESHKKNSNDRHHKDNDTNKSHRDCQIERKLEKEVRRDKGKRELKKKSDLENERSEHKDKKFEKNLNRDRKHSKKDKKSEVEHNESDAHKSKSKSKHKDRQREESKAKNESENVKKRKRDKSESPPTKPKVPKVVIDGIDSSMGTSFEEALGMIPIVATTSKTQIKVKSPKMNGSQTSSSYSTAPSTSASTSSSKPSAVNLPRLSKKSGTPPLLASTAKLEPLDPGIVLELPTISPNYKPMPLNPKVMECVFSNNKPQKRIMTDEEAFGAGISSKTIRTKVYSGTKSAASLQVPTLFDMCIRTLQKNIDALEYTGGVPFEVLRPVLERATPQQLLVFEDYNPYLMEDSDILWQQHCNRYYKCHKRLEMETWREMYLRCQEEQNEKLNMLAENIKQSQKQIALPVRKTQLAFVDEVKPPRNIMRKQEIFGTKAKPVATPAARVAALQNVSANIAKLGDTRLKVATGTRDTAQAVNSMRPRKAPLMQKTLQLMKGRFKR